MPGPIANIPTSQPRARPRPSQFALAWSVWPQPQPNANGVEAGPARS